MSTDKKNNFNTKSPTKACNGLEIKNLCQQINNLLLTALTAKSRIDNTKEIESKNFESIE